MDYYTTNMSLNEHSSISKHRFPSGDNCKPSRQIHLYEPIMLTHVPPLQIFFVFSHSFMSERC